MSILEDLYCGNIHPAEKFVKKGSAYYKINKQIADNIDELMPLLNCEEKQLYKKIEDGISKLELISEKECFIEGFRMGIQLMLEAMYYRSENYV